MSYIPPFDFFQQSPFRQASTLREELIAIEKAAVISLQNLHTLRVTGADRLDFLHGQLSNTVKGLAENGFNDSLMLNHKGHALAQMKVLRRKDDCLLLIEDNDLEKVQEQLQRHIIFDQVSLERSSLRAFSLQGAESETLVQALFATTAEGNAAQTTSFNGSDVIIFNSKRSGAGGFDLFIMQEQAEQVLSKMIEAGAQTVSQDAAEIARVLAVIPKAASEAADGVLPQEAGLEFAVSYKKGCYLGQEIMARIEARGNLRRDLGRLSLSGFTTEKSILLNDKRVGVLGTIVMHPDLGVLALAVLRNDIEKDATLSIGNQTATLAKSI